MSAPVDPRDAEIERLRHGLRALLYEDGSADITIMDERYRDRFSRTFAEGLGFGLAAALLAAPLPAEVSGA